MDLNSAIVLLSVAAAILSSAAYMRFKASAIPVMKECSQTLNLIWVFFKDATDGDGTCDMSQAPVILAMIEKCWVDLASLAPFIREILASVPRR